MIKLDSMLSPSRACDLLSDKKEDVLVEMVDLLVTSPHVTDRDAVLHAVLEREKIVSTGIGIGVAVPHVKIPQIKNFVIAVGRSKKGVDFQAIDDLPVHLVIMIGANDQQCGEYLKVLAEVIRRCKEPALREKIKLAKSPKDVVKEILAFTV